MEKGQLTASFGTAVRRHRLAQGLSQEELAQRAGLHRAYVGFVERGEKSVTLETGRHLAGGLGVPFSELLREAEAESA